MLVGTTLDETSLFGPAFGATAARVADVAFGPSGRSGASVLGEYVRSGSAATEQDARIRFLTDTMFRIPAIQLAEAAQPHSARTYMYVLSYASPPSEHGLGALHGIDLPFMWNRVDAVADSVFELAGKGPSAALAETMHGAWAAFVSTGVPQHASLPPWPRYDGARRATMRFDDECAVVDTPMDAERRLWENIAY
jgi:carboxylesterase type B